MEQVKRMTGKTMSTIFYILSLPGACMFKLVVLLQQWNFPEIVSIINMGICIFYGYREMQTTNDSAVGVLVKYCLIFVLICLFVIPLLRGTLLLLMNVFEPFFNINVTNKRRMDTLCAKPEKTIADFIEEYKNVSACGMERRPR